MQKRQGEHIAVGKFGRLTVLEAYKSEKGYPVCKCLCECGRTTVVYKCNLTSGRTRSCGCLEEANRRKHVDLRGKRFGALVATAPTEDRMDGSIVWRCACDCGAEVLVPGRYLVRGYTKSCGHHRKGRQDIANRRFGKLVALHPEEATHNGRAQWRCRCDCGRMCSVSAYNLQSGRTRSCGCLKRAEYRTMIEGTCLEIIASDTISKNNRSGVRGVSYCSKMDSWVATLKFKGKYYYLGKYKTVEEAADERRLAEEKIVDPFVDEHRHLLGRRKAEGRGCREEGADVPAPLEER